MCDGCCCSTILIRLRLVAEARDCTGAVFVACRICQDSDLLQRPHLRQQNMKRGETSGAEYLIILGRRHLYHRLAGQRRVAASGKKEKATVAFSRLWSSLPRLTTSDGECLIPVRPEPQHQRSETARHERPTKGIIIGQHRASLCMVRSWWNECLKTAAPRVKGSGVERKLDA